MLIARTVTGTRYTLDAVPVQGGDYATWTIGYDPSSLVLRCRKRPAKVAPPYFWTAAQKETWDGYAAANERAWYVEHQHGRTAAEIVAERQARSA